APAIVINTVAGDDIINATEDDSPVTISGTTTNVEDGQIATVTLNGTTYSPVVTAGVWTFDITALEAQALDPTETITADVSDLGGNPATQATRDIQYDATLPVPILEIDDITADNILNAAEAGADVAVTGTVSGDFNTGDTVTLTVDGTDYTGIVDALGAYSIDVPGSKLAADADTTVDGSVTTTDTAGNTASATDTQVYSVEIEDNDNDGLSNDEEIDLGTDPNNPDSDGDTISDGQEVIDGTEPLNDCNSNGGIPLSTSDCDMDGLSGSEESALGTDPENADSDGDGIDDGQEVNDGSNPLDACNSNGGNPPADSICDITIESDLINSNTNGGVFTINNIESFPNNTVRVYNRWGVLVYETSGYDNNANSFKGVSNGRVTIKKNDELPAGVYFYKIDYSNDQNSKTMNGYLYINR
ncbi:Ig-like domain-containing protein, partial [Zobellia sp.]|nr:Ig-like domain-containing protein [Zobellia sp.]